MYEDKVTLSFKWPLYGDKYLNDMQTGGKLLMVIVLLSTLQM